jgi:hypothetical protein
MLFYPTLTCHIHLKFTFEILVFLKHFSYISRNLANEIKELRRTFRNSNISLVPLTRFQHVFILFRYIGNGRYENKKFMKNNVHCLNSRYYNGSAFLSI